ncbi:hypothetical protein CHS0354_013489 [Potamilus streckersoni]|uniref:HMG box domain-containing protein n=1 Tax=Potamilus streckersoni TaxID=2493646 RepID=A0AAE0T8E4_9BIVA|nr:hypothetical protein CHS0354_013489 [Potamilus streckersoni]
MNDGPTSASRRKSNEKKAKDADDLLYNSMLEKHACVLWSSEHRRHYQLTRPDATPSEVDQLLRKDWDTLSLREKLRYLERTRHALRDENKPTKYKRKKAHDPPKEVKVKEDSPKPISRMMEKFLGMSPGVQLTEIKKWLHFYHEVSPDEYASVMTRFKQALKDKKSKFKSYVEKANKSSDSYDSTVDGQAKYRRLLFEKMLESREKIINLFTEKKAIQKKLLLDNFNSTVKKLIAGEEVGFVRGIKSERLTEVLNDLKSLESARKIGVSGEPIGTKSFENLTNQLCFSHYRDNSISASQRQEVYGVFENHPSEDMDLVNQFLLEFITLFTGQTVRRENGVKISKTK